jgi:SNF2 family DNA or RNA helicase
MEPGFNPALEFQAIGRVHRLGQKRAVEVVRLIVKDSVETRIRAFLEHKYGGASDRVGPGKKNTEERIGALGSQASEKPKSKILADEFDILFGVRGEDLVKFENTNIKEDAPDPAISSSLI